MGFAPVYLFYRGPQGECKNEFSNLVPVGLFNILNFLNKNGVPTRLYNLSSLSDKRLFDLICKLNPKLAFLSSFYGNHWETLKIVNYIKQNNPFSTTVIGGPISVIGEDILKKFKNVDYIINGEGELASLELLNFINKKTSDIRSIKNLIYRADGKIFKNSYYLHKEIDDFFYLPSEVMRYSKFIQVENLQVIITSRGCPFFCSFCSSPVLWGRKIRYHSIENIIKYIEDLIENFKVSYFSIRDDNFLSNKKRVIQFCKEILNRGWKINFNLQGSASFIDEETLRYLKMAGCDQIQIGIESLSPKVLKFFNKKIDVDRLKSQINLMRKYKIAPFGYFIAGLNETDFDIEPTINFIKNSGIMSGVLSPLVIYPGTKISKNLNIDNFFIKNREILYFSKKSYLKYKSKFDEAFKIAVNNNF